jgi:hypothetical protein
MIVTNRFEIITNSSWIVVVVIVWWLDLQLPVQSVPIRLSACTKVVSSNPPLRRSVFDISLSVTYVRSAVFSGYSGFLYQLNWPPRYNWNIVKSGVKHHNHNHTITTKSSKHYINKDCMVRNTTLHKREPPRI